MCDGDARNALNSLQMALQAKDQQTSSSSQASHISLDDIKDGIKVNKALLPRVLSYCCLESNYKSHYKSNYKFQGLFAIYNFCHL